MWNLTTDTNELICKIQTDIENKFMVTKEERSRGREQLLV